MTERLTGNSQSCPVEDASFSNRVNVLYIIDSLWGLGGAEVSLLKLIRGLPKDRFQCRVVTFHANQLSRPFLDQFPCPVYHWSLKNTWGISAFCVALKLRRLIREERINVVHTFFQTSDLWAAPIAKLSGAKVLVSSRRDMGFLRNAKHRTAYRLIRGLHDQVQAVSEEVRKLTIHVDRVAAKKTVTVYNGVDASSAKEMSKPGSEIEGQLTVVTIANIRHVKGIDILVKAAAIVHREIPGARIALAGRYGISPDSLIYREEIAALCREHNNSSYFQFLGECTNVPALLASSSVFVLPSRSEGHSNALLEAMLAGLPCVATTVGGNSETVVDGETGFLVPSENPELLADRLMRLLLDPGLRRRMGQAGRQRVLDHFTSEKMASRVAAAYEDVLARKGPSKLLRNRPLSAASDIQKQTM